MGNCCTRGPELKTQRSEFGDQTESDAPEVPYRPASPAENRTVEHYNKVLTAIREKYGDYLSSNSSTASEKSSKVYSPQIGQNQEMYTGQWKWGKKHGKGVQVWPDGFVYEGEWMQGKTAGNGRLAHQNGQYYIGQWFDNKFHGFGKYVSAASKRGFVGADKPGSSDRMSIYKESMIGGQCCEYEGMWDNDKQHGLGVEIWPDGSRFEGIFYQGLKHGQGQFKWRDGSSYQGNFNLGHIQGEGVFIWSDGSSYRGQWHNDSPHGQGTYKSADGRQYSGSYVDGLKEGYGVFLWGQGQKYEGQWKADKQHGPGTYTNSKGVVKQGVWVNGKLKRRTNSDASIMEPT